MFARSLGTRLAIALGSMLAIMLLAGFWTIESKNETLVAQEEESRAQLTAQSLVASLKSIMLAGRGDIAHDWLMRISELPDVDEAKVFRIDGKEAFMDLETVQRVNGYLDTRQFMRSAQDGETALVPAALSAAFSKLVEGASDQEQVREGDRLTFLYPIRTEEACMQCHGYTQHPLRGVLMLGVSTKNTQAVLLSIEHSAGMIFGLICCLTIFAIWCALRRQIIRPLRQLEEAAGQAMDDNLESRIQIDRDDEFGTVARAFNALMDQVAEDILELNASRYRQQGLTDAVISLGEAKASDDVLHHVGELAMALTDAEYAMIGYRDQGEKNHFISLGMTKEEEQVIAHEPEGKGLLGLLWKEGKVLRVDHIAEHPESVGFPDGHPQMTSFLGVPISFENKTLGVIYLTNKHGDSAFTEEDEDIVRVLASACAVAISNVRNMESMQQAKQELEQRVVERTLELTDSNRNLRSREVELEIINDELMRANQAKDQFLANTSHELRTPLNAIIGFSELLSNPRFGELNDKQNRYTGHIHESGKRLLGIINALLDISKIEAGMMHVDPVQCVASEIVEAVHRELMPLASEKELSFSMDIASSAHEKIITDADKLHQMLVNLAGNAIKFTPSGGEVCIRADLSPSDVGMQLKIDVQDNGIGISEADQQRIFEPFIQAEGGLARKYGGTGLGLALTRKQALLLGGRSACKAVWVKAAASPLIWL